MLVTDYSHIDRHKDKPPYNKVYPVVLSKIQFDKKPSAFRRLHNELDSTDTIYLSLIELLDAVTKGQTFKNGIHAKPSEQYHNQKLTKEEQVFLQSKKQELTNHEYINAVRLMKQQKIKNELKEANQEDVPELIKAYFAVLDVDDVLGKTNPIEVMKATGAIALYYTFSHETNSPINTKMFRYRLLFDLSEPVEGKEALEAVQQSIKNDILATFPYLHDQTITNEQTSKSKKHGIDNITKMFYGSNKGYEVNEYFETFDVADVISKFEKEQEFTKLVNKAEQLSKPRTRTTSTEILDIANFLGDMYDELDYIEWRRLAIGLWNTAQAENIDDNVILEALQILDGNRESDQTYLGLKMPLGSRENESTIGTLIMLAEDRGYKRKHYLQPEEETEQAPQIATRTHKIDKYIDKADMYKLLDNSDERILVQSDTNTGKTRASIEASKEYLQQHKQAFIYIAFPTKPLSQQAVQDYNLNQPIMENNNVQKSVKQAIYNNTRLLVGTYDKAEIVYNLLSNYEMIVIADEVHKEVFDYGYRSKAIQGLFDLEVTKFIGLTGTPSEIDFNSYDCLEVFQLDQPKVLADKLQFVNYYDANSYEHLTAQLIEIEVKQNDNKVLAFINNKKVINKLARALRRQGLKVATISADIEPLKSKNYMHIMKKQKFADDIEVILSTVVLADGININNTKDYVCMIAPSHYKNAYFFNIDIIKQATNRFRNQYSKIIIPFYINSELIKADADRNLLPTMSDRLYNSIKDKEPSPRMSDRLYNLENQYNYLLDKAEIMKAFLQAEFKDNIQDFTPSIAEKLSGLFRPKETDVFSFNQAYQNKQLAQQGLDHDEDLQTELERLESKLWDIDKRSIRQQASEDKERYYSLYPYAFQKAIKQALNVLEVEQVDSQSYLLEANVTKELAQIMDEINKLELKTEKDKRDNVKKILHELIYTKVQRNYFETGRVDGSLEEWKILSKEMSSAHYKALTKLVPFMSFDEVIPELEYIKKNAQMYELVNNFEAIQEIKQFQQAQGETITEKIFKAIQANVLTQSYHTKAELDEHLEELAKDFKIKGRYTIAKRQRLFKQAFKKYFVTGGSKLVRVDDKVRRISGYKIIEFEDIANKRDLSENDIKELYKKYRYSKGSDM